jgi:hypothetical protein
MLTEERSIENDAEENSIEDIPEDAPDEELETALQNTEGITPMKIWLSSGDRQVLTDLGHMYGLNNNTEIIRVAIREVLRNSEVKAEQKETEDDRFLDLAQRLDNLTSLIESNSKHPEEEEIEKLSEEQYDPEVISYFEHLDDKGLRYLVQELKGNPAGHRIGSYPAWKRKIDVNIQKLCPYTYRRNISYTRNSRLGLLNYLEAKGIISKK